MAKTASEVHSEAVTLLRSGSDDCGLDDDAIGRLWLSAIHLRLCESNELAEKQVVATARTNELLEQLVEKMGATGG